MGFIVKHSKKGGAKGSDLTEELGVFFMVRTGIFMDKVK